MNFLQFMVSLLLILICQVPARSAPFAEWKHSGFVYLVTTPEGANLPATVTVKDFPLLVRLHKDFFDFSQAQTKGQDLRFTSSIGEPLAYQIDDWDSVNGEASIWVRVPAIRGNSRQEIKLYWGQADAKSESDGKGVFNSSNGYVSVWHMDDVLEDTVGTLPSQDTGTVSTPGMIGRAKHLPGQKGVFCGEKIPNYPSGASSHSTEVWFRAEKPNSTIIGWGNEGGGRGSKVRMLFQSPPHIHIDSDFSDVNGEGKLSLGEWIHVVHTYDRDDGRIYINGQLDGSAKPLLNIKKPARLWIGGWYHNYDFVGDIDEVRISREARSADWIKLQFENQKPFQTLVGPVVQAGKTFAVSVPRIDIAEGQQATLTANAGGAQKVYWLQKRDGRETVVATDRFSFQVDAGRVVGDKTLTLQFKAVYPDTVKTSDIEIAIKEAIPEPVITLDAPAKWDARQTIEIVPQIANLKEMQAKNAGALRYSWTIDGIAVDKQVAANKLILKRAFNSGSMQVSVAVDNGGQAVTTSTTIAVQDPRPSKDAWIERIPTADEQPEDNQFYAREGRTSVPGEGTLFYKGTLNNPADSVFVRVFADDQLFKTETSPITADRKYTLAVQLKAGLIKYRTEFGSSTGGKQTILHSASNLVCGDVYLINGQSNAEATDIGNDDPMFSSDWIRSYGSTAGHPEGARLKRWGNACARDRNGGKSQIGYWGLELAKKLVETQKIPICVLNGAVGGTRIDQHQRNPRDPTDVTTIYGRLLWRAQQARLTHGVRGVLWHQGENDQGADGPTGGYGWETYRQNFIDLAGAWQEDYPNIQAFYVFQIWPKACSMGINGSDNKLREVQRTLPKYFSNLTVMSTLGVKPPGGCHFPKEGYAEFARLICPAIQYQLYHRFTAAPFTPPNLKRAYFTDEKRDRLVLEFDYQIVWSDALVSQFYLDGVDKQIESGSVNGTQILLKLKAPSNATKVTYLDSASWSPDNLLYGKNGMAALTFCDVLIDRPAEAAK